MKIEDGKIAPCSTCLRARQALKTTAGKLTAKALGRELPTRRLVELTAGDIVITTATNKITSVDGPDWNEFLGREVYLAGKNVYDVAAAQPIRALGQIVKVSPIE